MTKGGKIAMVAIPLILIGGVAGYIFFVKNKKSKNQIRENLATEGDFAQLVQAAQNSSEPNKFKGKSTIQLDAMWDKAKDSMSAYDMKILGDLYKLGSKHEHFDLKQFTDLNNKVIVKFLN